VRRGKVKREKGDGWRAEVETENNIAMTLSMVEEINVSSAGDNGAYSDGRSRKDKCGGSQRYRTGARTECGDSS